MTNIAMENHNFLIGKPSINGSFSMDMLNNHRVNHQRCSSKAMESENHRIGRWENFNRKALEI